MPTNIPVRQNQKCGLVRMQAKLAALKAVDVSALSPADSETHRLDVLVLELQIEDEQSYLKTVRSYLPSLQQVRAHARRMRRGIVRRGT